jgi:thiamine transport system ATP-binding protein
MRHLPARDVERRAREALELVGLAGFEHRRVRELSGGEQQRVALARALAPRPRLVLLDEPFASLDRMLRERLLTELRELLTSVGATALAVTHDQEEAFALADEVVLLREGRVEQAGRPEEVWHAPATEHAARFLGFTNVTDATVVPGDSGPTAVTAWGAFPVPAGTAPGRARLVVRPAGVHVGERGPLHGVVLSRTFRRDHFLLRVDTGPESGILEAQVDVAIASHHTTGTSVALAVDARAVAVVPEARG